METGKFLDSNDKEINIGDWVKFPYGTKPHVFISKVLNTTSYSRKGTIWKSAMVKHESLGLMWRIPSQLTKLSNEEAMLWKLEN